MNTIIDSQEKFIREHIIDKLKNNPEKDAESYSNIVNYSIDELIKINIRKTARDTNDIVLNRDILDESIELTELSIVQESERYKIRSDIKKYFDNAYTKYRPLSNEISKLKQQLFDSKEGKRVGKIYSIVTESQFPYEVGEIGLKDSIEGLILTPLSDSFQIDMGKVYQKYDVAGEWFPFEIKIDYLTFVLDDDGTIYVSTENYPKKLMEKAKVTLKELASDIYQNIDL